MHRHILFASCLAILACTQPGSPPTAVAIQPVPFTDVDVQDDFFAPWLDRNQRVTIPHNIAMCERTGVFDNFAKAGGLMEGSTEGMRNSDGPGYKVVEAASYLLAREHDAELDAYLDGLIAKIAAAQEPDGYLNTHRTVNLRTNVPDTAERWSNLRGDLELYLGGHLYEAAVAHFDATGKRSLLDVAIKHADLVDSIFGPDKRRAVGGHPNYEHALVKLYRTTGERRFLELARFFVDERGVSHGRQLFGEFNQDHKPFLEQTEAVGQAPRATYFFSGAADVAMETGEESYVRALEALWDDVVGGKMYVNGGIGSRHDNEGFGPAYELPNQTAYTESCAAVSFSMWNHRMFLLTGDAKYIDVLERTIYNNFLAGVSLSGDRYFYANPLESDGEWQFNRGWVNDVPGLFKKGAATRKEWFFCACCPPNSARYIEWLPTFFYATRGDELFVNFFVEGEGRAELAGVPAAIRQETDYPWDGSIRIGVAPERPVVATIKVRLPLWAQGQPVPGDLYRYSETGGAKPVLRVNGEVLTPDVSLGYARLEREWKAGDIIELDLAMPVRRVIANELVTENRGKAAIERGPIVYCAEGADNNGKALGLRLPGDAELTPEHRSGFLDGVTMIRGGGVTMIPYYVWSNRGAGEMAVWFETSAE